LGDGRSPTDIGIVAEIYAQNSGNAGKYAVTVTKAKRIAVMDDRTAFGQGEVEEFKKAVQAAGGSIVPAPVVWTRFCNSGGQLYQLVMTGFKG
jgi:branched-chain amino acid transport system substrate-binding protein